MGNWSVNNLACTTTWSTLRAMNQIPEDLVFKDSGTVKMNKLAYWGEVATAEMRQVQAGALANMMDKIFRMIRGAKYEEGKSNEEAVNDIQNTLLLAEKTIADLAEINDANYFFWKEDMNAEI